MIVVASWRSVVNVDLPINVHLASMVSMLFLRHSDYLGYQVHRWKEELEKVWGKNWRCKAIILQ